MNDHIQNLEQPHMPLAARQAPWQMPFFWPIAIGAFSIAYAAMGLLSIAGNILVPYILHLYEPDVSHSTDWATYWTLPSIAACNAFMVLGGIMLIRRGRRLPLQIAACGLVCVFIGAEVIQLQSWWGYLSTLTWKSYFSFISYSLVWILTPLAIGAGLALPAVRRQTAQWRQAHSHSWPVAVSAMAIGVGAVYALDALTVIGISALNGNFLSTLTDARSYSSLIQAGSSLLLFASGLCLLRYRQALALLLYPLIRAGVVIWAAIAYWPGLTLGSVPARSGARIAFCCALASAIQALVFSLILAGLTMIARPGRQVQAWRKQATDNSLGATTPPPQDMQS